jgi:ferrous iron transport protein B
MLSAVVLWFLQGFGFVNGALTLVEDNNSSLLAVIGNSIAFLFAPLGFGSWQSAVATLTGLLAKENVVTTFGVLFHLGEEVAGDSPELLTAISMHFNAVSAYSFMIFNLLCAPCFAAMGAIRREMNSAKWTVFAIGYMTVFAYAVSFMVYQFGAWFVGGGNVVGTLIALAVLLTAVYLLVRRPKREA